MKKNHIWWGQTSYIAIPGQRCFELISSRQQGICTACLAHHRFIYIRRVHQNTSGSVVSELMRFIHHIITYVVPVTPRVINWARLLIQKPYTCTCILLPCLYKPECMCICYRLINNNISDEGVRAVADGMKYCISLQRLL